MHRGIGRAFDDVIAVGMAKQPAARFRSSGELAAAATAAAWGTPVPTPMPAPVASRASPTPSPTPTPQKGTRAFSVAYPNPEDTGYSPYPVAMPAWVRPRRSRIPLIILGAAAVLLLVAGVLTAISALGNGGERRETASAAPSITTSTVPSTKTPSLVPVPCKAPTAGGCVGEPARCDPGNPPAAVVRTSLSLAVICRAGSGTLYYRGERIRDGAHIEISNAVRSSGGFDATESGRRHALRGASAAAHHHQQWAHRFLGTGAAVCVRGELALAQTFSIDPTFTKFSVWSGVPSGNLCLMTAPHLVRSVGSALITTCGLSASVLSGVAAPVASAACPRRAGRVRPRHR